MQIKLLLTIIAQDKPGIVEMVAKTVSLHDGNWLECRLAQLSEKFAGIIKVSVPNDMLDSLCAELNTFEAKHRISIHIDRCESEPVKCTRKSAVFSVLGPDRQGIVKEVSQAFAQNDINVQNLETQVSSMPYSGDPLFQAEGNVKIPQDIDIVELQERLDKIANNLGVDISFSLDEEK